MPGANNAFIVSLLLFIISIFLLFIPLKVQIKKKSIGYVYWVANFAKTMLWLFVVLFSIMSLIFLVYTTTINPLFFLLVYIFVLAFVIWSYRKKRIE